MFRIGTWIFLLTLAFMYNTYYDNAILLGFKKNKKIIKMIGIAFAGLSLYVFIQKFPGDTKDLVASSSNIIRFMPVDKTTKTALYNMTQMPKGYNTNNTFHKVKHPNFIQENKPLQGGMKKMKRNVGESKKKYVAANQQWRCGHCQQQLDATYEIDHVIELQNGGTNDISNLKALCRNCHGKKTMKTRMNMM